MIFDETILTEESPLDTADEVTEEAIDTIEEEALPEKEEAEEEPEPEEEEQEPADATEIAHLKAELESLKKELSDTRSLYARLENECTEFSTLYPEVSLQSIPDSIWQSVKRGVPLAAAYALEARKAELIAKRASQVNVENQKMSSGSLSSDSYNDFFTPSQVRSMTPAEVRANYTQIVNSMSKWH